MYKYSKSTDANILNVAATSYSIKHVLQYLGQRESILDEILRLLLRHIPWQFAVGESGKVVAILQDVQLEIRTSRDEYCTVVGKAVVPKDPYPQWRRLAWSPDCSMLAVSHSNGSVSFYDLLGSNLFNIYPLSIVTAILQLGQACTCRRKRSCELLLVNYHAELRAFLVSPTDGYQENHTFSFAQHHRQGIVAVAYHPSHHLLFLAGPSALFSASALKGLGSSMGLSAWRLLNDYPFYRLALSTDEEEALLLAHRSLWNWVPSFRRSRNHIQGQSGVQNQNRNFKASKRLYKCNYCKKSGHKAADCWTKMANEKQVSMASEQTHAVAEEIVTLTSSSVSALCAKLTRRDDVWCVDSGATTHMCRDKNSFLELTPTISQKKESQKTLLPQVIMLNKAMESHAQRLYKFWSLREQPDYNVRNPLVERGKAHSTITPDDSEFHPIDINWWSDQAVIIARFCGAVSVCAVANLRNLLGESPEFLAGQPQVSALCNPQGFLSLECESLLTSNKRLAEEDDHWVSHLLATLGPDSDIKILQTNEPLRRLAGRLFEETSVDESEEDESPFLSQGSAFLQSAVYLVTDMERFQPKRKRLRVLHRTYRLLGLKSTTPEELYSRKIDNEEYDEALSLAHAYNLDCDQVYQRQWRNSEVSIDTIHNFLSKITKRSWVLNECVKRVPETFAAAKELLLYGLQVTSLETLVAIGEGTDGGHFVLKTLKENTIIPDVASETDTPEQSLLDKINMDSLTESQGDLIRYRRKLLQYLDMLCTYELILGGCHLAPDQYSHRFYAQFRDAPPLLSAVQFARESQPQAVGHLLTYHSDLVLPHWLPMLSNFPETMPPYEYRELLPECDPQGRVFPRPRKRLRNADWCEESPLLQAVHPAEDSVNVDVDLGTLYEDDPALNQFVMENLTREAVSSWYSARVSQVESRSCLVDHALALVKLAQERNITGLDVLHHQLLLLDTLVYSVNLEHMTLAALQKLSELDKVKLLMSKILLPYLTRCDRRSPGSRIRLLREYLVDVSARDLALPLKLFQALRDEEVDILGSVEEMMNLALLCLYSCPREDQMEQAQMILECVPERGPPGTLSDVLSSLHDKLDDLELDLCAAEILKSNSVPKPLSFIRDFKSNSTTVQQLLTKMARTLGKKWEVALRVSHSSLMSSDRMKPVSGDWVIYVSTLLSSGSAANIKATEDILQCREVGDYSKKVPFTRAVALVLQAATEYFDSAGDLLDPAMELARLVLQWYHYRHTTSVVERIRLCDDRMRLIEACVRNKPKAFRQCVRLLKLAEKLWVAGADSRAREGQVLVLVAQTAFQARDYLFCANMCRLLVDKSLVVGWRVARELGQCDEFADLHSRLDLLSFSLLHCSSDLIEELITARCHLEAQLLQDQIVRQVELQNGESYVSDEEFSDALTSVSTFTLDIRIWSIS
uniref:Sec39 domain-containing protein n=1 Tax=Timema douglasi TaxID=61478 RepID=A0A7R8VK68_TIMDO|nr:unnamed protein product [Timema douglasi]